MRILICGDSFKNITGLSYIALNLLKYFQDKGHKVAYCIISGSKDSLVTEDDIQNEDNSFYEDIKNIPIFNSQIELQDTYNIFDDAIEYFKPNVVFSVHDLWRLDKVAFSKYRGTYKWIAYCPIESSYYFTHIIYPTHVDLSFRKSIKSIAQQIDLAIPYTQMGSDVLNSFDLNNISTPIYNGIEDEFNNNYKFINRDEVFKGNVSDEDFIFMTTGGNFTRKGLDYVVEAFYMFLKKVENPKNYKLYVHGDIDTINAGTDIKSMMYSLGIMDNCILTKKEQITKEELYKRYSVCDCYIGLPLAEGFGLGFAEALLNKLPIIYHNFGGHREYLKDIGYPIQSVANFHPINQFTMWKIPDVNETAMVMLYVVRNINSKEIKDRVKKGYSFTKDNLIWENLYKKFDEVLNPFLAKNNNKNDIINKLSIRRMS